MVFELFEGMAPWTPSLTELGSFRPYLANPVRNPSVVLPLGVIWGIVWLRTIVAKRLEALDNPALRRFLAPFYP